MKRLMIAMIFTIASTQGHATGMTEALVDPEVIMAPEEVAQGAVGSGGFVVPLLLLALIAVAISTTTGGGGDPVPKVPPL